MGADLQTIMLTIRVYEVFFKQLPIQSREAEKKELSTMGVMLFLWKRRMKKSFYKKNRISSMKERKKNSTKNLMDKEIKKFVHIGSNTGTSPSKHGQALIVYSNFNMTIYDYVWWSLWWWIWWCWWTIGPYPFEHDLYRSQTGICWLCSNSICSMLRFW